MANHNITITASQPNYKHPHKSKLTLDPAGTTYVNPGDTITWIVAVDAITAIMISDDSDVNVFNPDPAPVAGSKNWIGTINPAIALGSSEEYSIYWTQGGVVYSFDPKIAVNN